MGGKTDYLGLACLVSVSALHIKCKIVSQQSSQSDYCSTSLLSQIVSVSI